MAGVLYGSTIGTIRQETFSYNYSIEILVMVVLGGMGSINGSLIAAAVITYLNILLQSQLSGALAPVKNIVYALILILIVNLSLSVSLWARARGSHRLKKQKMSVLEVMAGSASPGRNIRPFVRK
jgi:ABC-type branched-subunit amino acid transport system permease subunit